MMSFYLNGKSIGCAYTNICPPVRAAVTLYAINDEITLIPNCKLPSATAEPQPTRKPNQNFTWDPNLSSKALTFSYHNQCVRNTWEDKLATAFGSQIYRSGTHYFEVEILQTTPKSNIMIGVSSTLKNTSKYLSHHAHGWGLFCFNGYPFLFLNS